MKKFALLLAMLVSSVMIAVAAPHKVAVYVEGNISSTEKASVNSAVLSRMSGNKEYQPFERNKAFLNALTKEVNYQTSGEVPEKEIRNIGSRLGVDYVIVVHITVYEDGTCMMAERLINMESGNIVKSVDTTQEYTNPSELVSMAKTLTYRLINSRSK